MRRLWSVSAVLALCSLLLPWARLSAVSFHLSAEHHEVEADLHADDLEESFHGHRHAQSERDHQHPLIGCDLVAHRTKVIRAMAAPASIHLAVAPPPRLAAQAVTRARRNVGNDHGPPEVWSPRPILRI